MPSSRNTTLNSRRLRQDAYVEIGTHNFYRTLPGKPEKLTTVAKFMHIWQQDGKQWRVSRIISYAHSATD